MATLSTSRERQRVRDSYGYDPAKDPWSAMSPEDRRKAHKLWMKMMRAFPGSPAQDAHREELVEILNRYGIGE
jgi:hypothetical protein